MKILFSSLVLVAGLALAGCATAEKLNDVRIGMTKDQVVSLLGTPDSTSAQANVEYLTYYLIADPTGDNRYDRDQPYMIRLVDGKVESFGRYSQLMDLYFRPVPTTSPQMQVVVPQNSSGYAPAQTDIATQLQRLKTLKDQGVLTEEEFEKAKAKLLSSGTQ